MIHLERYHQVKRFAISRARLLLAGLLLTLSPTAHAMILWSQPGTVHVCNNGKGVDVLHGAIKPQDSNSTSTLYFKFRVDPNSDALLKNATNYIAGFFLFERGEERLGLGNGWEAWGYTAMNVAGGKDGLVDLNSASPDRPPLKYEFVRSGSPKNIAFKVEFNPGHDAHVTVWLNPDLVGDATELSQPTNIVTQFYARATFDEIHIFHQGAGGGWKFSKMLVATSFQDLVVQHFWKQKWFIGLLMGGLLLAVGGIVRFSERKRAQRQIRGLEQEKAVASERARIARDIHDDLGASLTKIHKLAEMMDQKSAAPDAKHLSKSISYTARDAIQTMDEIVWAVNPKNDSLKEMADYLVFFTEDFLRPSGIRCTLDVPLNLPNIPVNADVRHNVFMVVKEALNNAAKHATARHIKFALNCHSSNLAVEIADNGKGFQTAQKTKGGDGLENMRRRINAIGGHLDITTEPGNGTTVRLNVLLSAGRITFK